MEALQVSGDCKINMLCMFSPAPPLLSFTSNLCGSTVDLSSVSWHLLDDSIVALEDVLMRQLDKQGVDGAHADDQQRFEDNR